MELSCEEPIPVKRFGESGPKIDTMPSLSVTGVRGEWETREYETFNMIGISFKHYSGTCFVSHYLPSHPRVLSLGRSLSILLYSKGQAFC